MKTYGKRKGLLAFAGSVSILSVLVILSFTAVCFSDKEALASEPIVIGSPLPVGFLQGEAAKQGIELAVAEINGKGGVKVGDGRRQLKLEIVDTRDLSAGVPVSESLLAVERLILVKKADFLLGGPLRSEAALAVMDLTSKHKTVSIITAGNITPIYTKKIAQNYDKYKYLFRLSTNAVYFVGETLRFLGSLRKQFGYNRVSIMIQDVLHARTMAKFVKGGLTKMGGWEINEPQIYPTGSMDYSMGLLKAKREKAQIIFVWMDHPEVSIMIKQAYDFKVPALLVGKQGGLQDAGFWKATNGKCVSAISTEMKAGSLPIPTLPGTREFFDAHNKMYGKPPQAEWTGMSYMGVYTLAEAIERAGTINAEAVITELERTDRPSIIGRIKFDPKSHQLFESLDPDKGTISMWTQWQAGKRVPVFPPAISQGAIPSPWVK
jgi:branched-chain amino acid transport system substrate-binding protein